MTGTLLLFWDYDTQWGADRSRSGGGPKAWGPLEFPATDRLLELHARYDIAACFAVVGSAALPGERPYHDPGQVRAIHAAGHEIASHAHRHEWLPALSLPDLRETLRASKAALEDCTGAAVTGFVPPFNQPFDRAGRLAISRAERRQAGRDRVGLGRLCAELDAAGYGFARVAYRGVAERLRGEHRPGRMERIAGLPCARLNTPGGFDGATVAVLDAVAERGGLCVAYGHPHSIGNGSSQDEAHLVPFLERVAALRDEGRLRIARPRDLTGAP